MSQLNIGTVRNGAETFELFPCLPTELREMIWLMCLPYRVYEIDEWNLTTHRCAQLRRRPAYRRNGRWSHIRQDLDDGCNIEQSILANLSPPVLTRVCHESRAIILRTWQPLGSGCPCWIDRPDTMKGDRHGVRGISYSQQIWSDIGTVPHAGVMTKIGIASAVTDEAALSRGLLKLATCDADFRARVLEGDPNPAGLIEVFALLEGRQKWFIVVETLIIHGSQDNTAVREGLFGLLGDAPVQIIDLTDVRLIRRYLAAGQACNNKAGIVTGACGREDIQSFEDYEFDSPNIKALLATTCSDDLVKRCRPAVQFRLCMNPVQVHMP